MGGLPQKRPKKFKLLKHSCQTHEFFRVGKFYKKIKFDKIWKCQNGAPLVQPEIKKGVDKNFFLFFAYANPKVLIYANCNEINNKSLAITGSSSILVHTAHSPKQKNKSKRMRLKVASQCGTHAKQANDMIIISCRYYIAGWHSKVCSKLRTNEADNSKKNCPRPKLLV